MHYKYKIELTNKQEVYLRELTLEEYKNLQKVCIESDIELFKNFVKAMITDLSGVEVSSLNIIDIFNFLLVNSYSFPINNAI